MATYVADNSLLSVVSNAVTSSAVFQPHTSGGCFQCKSDLTISNDELTRNVSYYIIGHVSKFVASGSVRIASNTIGNLQTVAFKTPAGKRVLLVEYESN